MSTQQPRASLPTSGVVVPLRVLIVDDHAATLAALASLIDHEYPRLEVAGRASGARDALRMAREIQPDVIVLDLDLGGVYGIDLMPHLALCTDAAVVVHTAADDAMERAHARAAGACAFVSKLAPAQELIAAIEASCNPRDYVGGLSSTKWDTTPRNKG